MSTEYWGAEQVQRVRESVSIIDVAHRVLSGLTKAGKGYTCLCPFHDEKTPSFHVLPADSDRPERFHCYGCGAHGDAIDLVRKREGCSFQAAVRLVAEVGGIPLENQARQRAPDDRQVAILSALEFAAQFYEEALPGCTEALAYVRDRRRFSADTCRAFRIGWAAGGGTLVAAASEQGLGAEVLIAAGLASDRDGRLVDVFHRRVVVPVADAQGRVLAFTGRALPEDCARNHRTPKYINSAETPVYCKGRTVFALHRARTAAREARRIVVVEGALDAIACAQAGMPETVAPLGTAFTADHAQAIAAAVRDLPVIVALDGDAAGETGAERAVAALSVTGATVKLAVLPAGRDPAELLLEAGAQGAAAFQAAITGATTAWPWLVQRWMPGPLAELGEAQRLSVFDRIVAHTGQMPDEVLRDLLREHAAGTLGIKPSIAKKRCRQADAATTLSTAPAPGHPGDDSDEQPPRDEPAHPGAFLPEFELNDTGNARRILSFHGDDLRYCHTWGTWLVWKGTHWSLDLDRTVERLATAALAASLDQDLARLAQEPKPVRTWWNRALHTWRTRSGDRGRVVSALEQLAVLAEVATTAEVWDRDPQRFTVANGTLDLATSVLHPHLREDRITRLCPVVYDPSARNDRWEGFLREFTQGQAEVAAYLRRMAGYSLTGDTRDDAVLLLQGPGGDGKSTFASAIAAVLGDYARPIPFETFLQANADKSKWSLAECSQMRLIVAEESQEDAVFNSALLKSLTGGGEIEAQRKHGHPFRYTPRFKVWLLTNPLPNVRDTDQGFFRRLHLVRCQAAAHPDRSLRPYLASDPDAQRAILAWMVAGAREWAAGGLRPPVQVTAWRDAYRAEQNPLTDALAELFVVTQSEADQLAVGEWTKAYRQWCETHGQRHPLSAKGAFQRLEKLGVGKGWVYDSTAGRTVRAYVGIRLRHAGDLDPGVDPSPRIEFGMCGESVATGGDTPASDRFGHPLAPASVTTTATAPIPALPEPQERSSSDTDSPHIATLSPHIATPMCGELNQLNDSILCDFATDSTDPTRTRASRARATPHAGEDQFPQLSASVEKRTTSEKSVAIGGESAAPPEREPGDDEDEPPHWPGDPFPPPAPITPAPRTPIP